MLQAPPGTIKCAHFWDSGLSTSWVNWRPGRSPTESAGNPHDTSDSELQFWTHEFLNTMSAKLTLKVPRNCAVLHLSKCRETTFSLVSRSTKRNIIPKGTEKRSVEVSVSSCFHFWNTDVNLQSWRSLPSCILLSRAHNKADREMPVVGRAFHISASLAPGRLCVHHVMVGVRNQGIHPALFPPSFRNFQPTLAPRHSASKTNPDLKQWLSVYSKSWMEVFSSAFFLGGGVSYLSMLKFLSNCKI